MMRGRAPVAVKASSVSLFSTLPLRSVDIQRKCAYSSCRGVIGAYRSCRPFGMALQPKLTVNQYGNRFEQEAENVVDQAIHILERGCMCQTDKEEKEPRQIKPLVQSRIGVDDGCYEAPPIVNEVLRLPGQSLDSSNCALMESLLGYDFSRVRVHTDAKAAESARVLNAAAYTVGQDVVFDTGQFAPGIARGRRLLAHELIHTVQQRPSENTLPAAQSITTRQVDNTGQTAENTDGNTAFIGTRAIHASAPTRIFRERSQVSTDPRVGGNSSGTTPSYTVDDVKRRLATFNLGLIRGDDLVRDLDAGRWRIFFWRTTGHAGLTDSGLILLPREASLMANVSTLFHEGMHATRPVPGSTGLSTDPRAVWTNLEEELAAQYQAILFLRAHASTVPKLVNESSFSDDWPRIERMNKGELYRFFQDEAVVWTIIGKMTEYRHVILSFGGDIGRMASSPQVTAILNRVILGERPRINPPRPQRPTLPSLIQPRRDFRRKILESVNEL